MASPSTAIDRKRAFQAAAAIMAADIADDAADSIKKMRRYIASAEFERAEAMTARLLKDAHDLKRIAWRIAHA